MNRAANSEVVINSDVKRTEQATYGIGVAARMTGISAHTLRMWERRYRLKPSKRSEGGQRAFTLADIHHLKLLKQLTKNGVRIGHVAHLPTKSLTSLLLESGQMDPLDEQQEMLSAQVFGPGLCAYFKSHKRRFPNIEFEFSDLSSGSYLGSGNLKVLPTFSVFQVDTLNHDQFESLKTLSEQQTHVIIFYLYADKSIREKLSQCRITLVAGGIDDARIDETMNKVLRLREHLTQLEYNNERFKLPSTPYPRQFSEQELVEFNQSGDNLNCECVNHLVDLIGRLNAFEDYSKNCESDYWQQAATHACIYSYANQARYLMEKALLAVLDE
ncbi:MAG: DNA-binding transcriptional MerR regulator [Cellvibrionaceae bacterium]|jgi:DNA-binding transcriptional MerR regulator